MKYVLIILYNSHGFLSSDIRSIQIPLQNEQACYKVADNLLSDGKGVSAVCINTETGELMRFKTHD